MTLTELSAQHPSGVKPVSGGEKGVGLSCRWCRSAALMISLLVDFVSSLKGISIAYCSRQSASKQVEGQVSAPPQHVEAVSRVEISAFRTSLFSMSCQSCQWWWGRFFSWFEDGPECLDLPRDDKFLLTNCSAKNDASAIGKGSGVDVMCRCWPALPARVFSVGCREEKRKKRKEEEN